MTRPNIEQTVCGEVAEFCLCEQPPKHEGPHVCECGGEWRGSIGGPDFEVVVLPWPGRSS